MPSSAIVDWHYKAAGSEEFIHVSTVILWIRKHVVRLFGRLDAYVTFHA